ncbi:50S ribosomal protein L13 [Candidatus Woesearchaeota archaeon CG_4_10_14_0_8_um_filter_47_5]|nr:MAG: 50S ribosomal protein L13 [Candidatus Woesearchaeota archaeon CG_4_10_14_0_8_um_filter_47_5]
MKLIDATDLIVGRLASYAAKQALLGESIHIINCEKAVITGSKSDVVAHYRRKRARGEPFHGPFFPRTADRLMKRTVRGMLPYKQEKGRKAFGRVKTYLGAPTKFKDQKTESLPTAHISKVPSLKHVTLQTLCIQLGVRSP